MIDAIHKSFRKGVDHRFNQSANTWFIEEDDPGAFVKQVDIEVGSGIKTCCIKLDNKRYGHLCTYLNKLQKGFTAACDAMMFVETSSEFVVLLIELKSDNFDKSDLARKYHASSEFLKYSLGMMRNIKKLSIPSPKVLNILFSSQPVAGSNPRQPITFQKDGVSIRQYYAFKHPKSAKFNVCNVIR